MLPNWVVGVLLATLASVISNLGLNLQKLNHTRNEQLIRKQLREARKAAAVAPGGGAAAEAEKPLVNVPATAAYGGTSLNHLQPGPALAQPPHGSAGARVLSDSQTYFQSSDAAADGAASSDQKPQQQPLLDATSSPLTALQRIDYTRQGLWRLGLSLVMLGSLADFAALMFAAASIVAPLGSLTLVSNTLLAPLLLGESITRRDLLATGAIVAGSVVAVTFADHEERILTVQELFDCFATVRVAVYGLFVALGVTALMTLQRQLSRVQLAEPRRYQAEGLERVHRFTYAALAGMVGAQSVLFAKCTGEILVNTFRGHTFLALYWQTYAIVAAMCLTIVAQVRWLNRGLQQWDALYIVPVFQSFWILLSVTGGMVFFDEWKGVFDSSARGIMFPLGVITTIAGVYVLSQRGGGGGAAARGGGGVMAATPVPRNFKHYKPYKAIAAERQRADWGGVNSGPSASPLEVSSASASASLPRTISSSPPLSGRTSLDQSLPLTPGTLAAPATGGAARVRYSSLSGDDGAEYEGIDAADLEAAVAHAHAHERDYLYADHLGDGDAEHEDVSFVSPAPPLPLMSAATAALIDAPLIGYSADGDARAFPRRTGAGGGIWSGRRILGIGSGGKGKGVFQTRSQPSSWKETSALLGPSDGRSQQHHLASQTQMAAGRVDLRGSSSDDVGYQSHLPASPSSAPSVLPVAASLPPPLPLSTEAPSAGPVAPTAFAASLDAHSSNVVAEIDPADLLAESSPDMAALPQIQLVPAASAAPSSSGKNKKKNKKGKH